MSFNFKTVLAATLSTFCAMILLSTDMLARGKSYESEYIVFAGRDSRGKVIFAMERLRSEGTKWEWTVADHTVYMYAQGKGWVKLKGRNGSLDKGPKSSKIGGGSDLFEIRELTGNKMIVTSDANGLILRMKSEVVGLDNRKGREYCRMSSGKATMHYKGRNLKGQVFRRGIHLEGISEVNRLTDGAKKGWHSESLYLNVGELGFFYGYRHNDKFVAKHAAASGIMLTTDSLNIHVKNPEILATRWKSIGLYDMPFEWQGAFHAEGREIRFKITSSDLKNTENYFLKGSRVGYARGFVSVDGRSYPLYGITEVANCVDGKRGIEAMQHREMPEKELEGQTFEAILTRVDD